MCTPRMLIVLLSGRIYQLATVWLSTSTPLHTTAHHCTHTDTHTHTHTHTHAHIHTDTQTHICILYTIDQSGNTVARFQLFRGNKVMVYCWGVLRAGMPTQTEGPLTKGQHFKNHGERERQRQMKNDHGRSVIFKLLTWQHIFCTYC